MIFVMIMIDLEILVHRNHTALLVCVWSGKKVKAC